MKNPSTHLTQSDLDQFTGDDVRFRSMNPMVIYSPGIRHVAEFGEAYWLIDAIVSYFGGSIMKREMKKDNRIQCLQFWRLDVKESSAILSARADSNTPPFITQRISFTGFPLAKIDIWAGFNGKQWALYLPSEH